MELLRNNRFKTLAVTSIFIAALLFGFYRSQFGLNYTDEGYYLATAMRISLGDLPFRDEIINPQRMFDIVLAPVFMLAPDVTVYQLRCANVILEVFASLFLFFALRRFAPAVPLALACALSVFLMNLSWIPNYHNLPVTLTIMAWCAWVLAIQKERKARAIGLAVLSGALLFVAAIIYVPLLAILVSGFLPVLVVENKKHTLLLAVIQVSTVLCLFGLAVLSLVWSGLAKDYIYATIAITSPSHYALSLSQKMAIFVNAIWPDLAIFVAAAGIAYWLPVLLKRQRIQPFWLTAAASLVAGSLLVLLIADPSSPFELQHSTSLARYMRVALACYGLHAGVLLRVAMHPINERDRHWRAMYLSALTSCVLLGFVYAFLSVGAFKMMFLVPFLFPLAIAAIARQTDAIETPSAKPTLALLLFVAPFVYVTYVLPWQYVMKERNVWKQTTNFSTPRLTGIKTIPADARSLDALALFLKDKVAPGDFLLAYHHLPVIYYLTKTRPSLDVAWSAPEYPHWCSMNSLQYMIQEKRVPRYCVRLARAETSYSSDPRIDPVNALVERHYEKIATIPYTELEPFCEIFQLRKDSPLQAMTP